MPAIREKSGKSENWLTVLNKCKYVYQQIRRGGSTWVNVFRVDIFNKVRLWCLHINHMNIYIDVWIISFNIAKNNKEIENRFLLNKHRKREGFKIE